MKTRIALPLSFLAMSLPMFAQTTHRQPQAAHCQLADYVCNQIPLDGGGQYSFVSGWSTINVGDYFNLYVNGVSNGGKITQVIEYPPLRIGDQGPFSCDWSANGLTGNVSGYIVVKNVGRWPMAWIETSIVTVN